MESGESSWLLLALACGVTLLMALVAFGDLRRLQLSERALARWGGLAVAGPIAVVGIVFGTGLSAASVLALGSESLKFTLGYAVGPALLLWLGGCAVATVLMALPAWSRRAPALGLTGTALAALALALQCGWIGAAGLRPGVTWQLPLLALAGLLQVVAFVTATWLALSTSVRGEERSLAWSLSAAMLLAVGVWLSQEVVIGAAGVATQVGSIYTRQIPGPWLCVAVGALVPTTYGFLLLLRALQGSQRHQGRREADSLSGPRNPRRRRHRIPTL